MSHSFVIKGNLVYTPERNRVEIINNGYLAVEAGKISGCFSSLPERYAGAPLFDYQNLLVIPGLCDAHVHAPQYAFRGLGMDLELLEWLNQRAFPEEARYKDLEYAGEAYRQFADALKNSATTRVSVFATLHVPATLCLTKLLEEAGVAGYVGKVNMDRNSPQELQEAGAEESLEKTREWLEQARAFRRIRPILTPRFIPSCTDALLDGLAKLRQETGLPLQSHLSENLGEIQWVRELCPNASCYAQAYALHGLMEPEAITVMAHCVHPMGEETTLLAKRGVLAVHCPASNTNLASGIAPVRMYLENGVSVGLGSDVAGGQELSIFRAMTDAVQVSKLRFFYDPEKPKPLSLWEAFYLGTKGAAPLFGKVGSFEKGYEADILVLDDSAIPSPRLLSVRERMERAICFEKEVVLKAKYVAGEPIALS